MCIRILRTTFAYPTFNVHSQKYTSGAYSFVVCTVFGSILYVNSSATVLSYNFIAHFWINKTPVWRVFCLVLTMNIKQVDHFLFENCVIKHFTNNNYSNKNLLLSLEIWNDFRKKKHSHQSLFCSSKRKKVGRWLKVSNFFLWDIPWTAVNTPSLQLVNKKKSFYLDTLYILWLTDKVWVVKHYP